METSLGIDLSRFKDRFIEETREKLKVIHSHLIELESALPSEQSCDSKHIDELMRLFHSIKGSARMLGYTAINKLCHANEDLLSFIKSQPTMPKIASEVLNSSYRGIEQLLTLSPDGSDSAKNIPNWFESTLYNIDVAIAGGEIKPVIFTTIDEQADNHTDENRARVTPGRWLSRTSRVDVESLDSILSESREFRRRIEQTQAIHKRLSAIKLTTNDFQDGSSHLSEERFGVTNIRAEFEQLIADLGEQLNIMNERMGTLDKIAVELRMRTLDEVFKVLPTHVRELSTSLGKSVKVDFMGGELRLDGRIVEVLSDSLVHIIRNAVDHGIEKPDVRTCAGKQPEGWIWVSARETAGMAVITVADDGCGVDLPKIWERAAQIGITKVSNPEQDTLREGYKFLFDERFTSRTDVSNISGRGVGLADVKRRIMELGGDVTVESELGMMTRIIITVPTSLSSQRTLIVEINSSDDTTKRLIGIPMSLVQSTFRYDHTKPSLISFDEWNPSESALPVVSLDGLMNDGNLERPLEIEEYLVIVGDGIRTVIIATSRIIRDSEVVIEPLPTLVQSATLVAGASSMEDDNIMLILNVPALLNKVYRRATDLTGKN